MKKGFTLIELLAVIVILALIALITVPIIQNVINSSSEEINKRSIDMYAKAIKQAASLYELEEGIYPSNIEDIEIYIEYDGAKVECETSEIYKDGNVYLDECKVEDEEIEYTYGTKKVCSAITGDGTNAGDEISCEFEDSTENFYVISNNGTKLEMLTANPITLDTNNSVQSADAAGTYFASIDEDSNSYFYENSKTIDKYLGEEYPFVYDENSNLSQYISSYKNSLEERGLPVKKATLLSYYDLLKFGIKESEISGIIINLPEWLSGTYWIGSTCYSGYFVGYVYNTALCTCDIGPEDDELHIRPLITIKSTDIK